MPATPKTTAADYKVSLTAKTVLIIKNTVTFDTHSGQISSVFGHYDFSSEVNRSTPQSHRQFNLSFDPAITTGTYTIGAPGSPVYGANYFTRAARPGDETLFDYIGAGTVSVKAVRKGDEAHFNFLFTVEARREDGVEKTIKGDVKLYVTRYD